MDLILKNFKNMQAIYNIKGREQLLFFNKAWILFVLFQVVSCKCGNKPINYGDEAERDTTQQTTQQSSENKPTLTLIGPNEVKKNPTLSSPVIITLKLKVTNGTLNTNDYKLQAIDLKNYAQKTYIDEQVPAECHTKVSGTDGKTLQVLTGKPTLTKNDKIIRLKIPVVVSKWMTYNPGRSDKLVVPYSESAKFQFAILDKAGNTVAGPIEVKWTRDII